MKIFQKFLLIPSWYIFGEFLVRFSEFLPFDPYRGGGLADPQIGLDQETDLNCPRGFKFKIRQIHCRPWLRTRVSNDMC